MYDMPAQEIVYIIDKGNISIPLAGITIPPKEERNMPYSELPRTAEDEKRITELISSLGSFGYWDLLTKEKYMRKLGDQIRYVHPFKFLGYIYSNPDLKAYMKNIMSDYFIKKEFILGISETLNLYYQTKRLNMYISDFANEINIPANQIEPFIASRDWPGLINLLTNY